MYQSKEFRLNSVSDSIFAVNSTDARERERQEIVAQGRALAMETAGKTLNQRLALLSQGDKFEEPYVQRLSATEYAAANEKTTQRRILYAARLAANAEGRTEPQTVEDVVAFQRDYAKSPTFLRVMAGIDQEVVRPLLPYVLANVLGPLAKFVDVAAGETYEVDVLSNDFFVFQDGAWGAHNAAPLNALYSRPFTLNPSPFSAAAEIKFRQLLSSKEDLGAHYNAIMAGLGSKIMALWTQAMISAASNSFFFGTGYTFSTATKNNLISASKVVSAVNHMDRSNCMIFGDIIPLSNILPLGTAQDAALTYGLGPEWFNRGYMGTVYGMRTFSVDPSVVPTTQNSAPQFLMPTDMLFVAGMPNRNVQAPIWIALEENTPITITNDPMESSDMKIRMNITAAMDVKPIVSSKVAVITNA